MKKKIIAIAMALVVSTAMIIPAYAVTPSLETPKAPTVPEIKVDFKLPESFWDKWFKDHPIIVPDKAELSAPEITEAKYVHAKQYSPACLKIKWTAVEGAETYEVLITKADGETITYITNDTEIYDKNAECCKVYIEKTNTWTAATVRVRAISDDVYSEWSEPAKIGCNKLH